MLFHAGISSQFLVIPGGFNTKCHLLKMLPPVKMEKVNELALKSPDVWAVCVAASRDVCFRLH